MIEAAELSSQAEFIETFKQLESLNEDKIMTMAEQFRQEGRQQGRHDASYAIVFNFMKMGLGL